MKIAEKPKSKVLQMDSSLKDAIMKMKFFEANLLPVFDKDKVAGILSIRDIAVYLMIKHTDPAHIKIKEAFGTDEGQIAIR